MDKYHKCKHICSLLNKYNYGLYKTHNTTSLWNKHEIANVWSQLFKSYIPHCEKYHFCKKTSTLYIFVIDNVILAEMNMYLKESSLRALKTQFGNSISHVKFVLAIP